MEANPGGSQGIGPQLRRLGIAAGLVSLAGCCTAPVIPTTQKPVIIPLSLTAPCEHEASPETNGELLDAYAEARLTIAECDARLAQIRLLSTKDKSP